MGRALLVCRLAVRDLRRRRVEAALLLLAVMAATTTLTLGLVLRDAAGDPYQTTREATNGPDVVASVGRSAGLPSLEDLASAPGVTDHSGPYPVTPAKLRHPAEPRTCRPWGATPRPRRSTDPGWSRAAGSAKAAWWSRPPSPARSMWASVTGVTLNGRSLEVVGVAVTAAMPPYPAASCIVPPGCASGAIPGDAELPPGLLRNPGLVWLTQADVRSLAPDPESLST